MRDLHHNINCDNESMDTLPNWLEPESASTASTAPDASTASTAATNPITTYPSSRMDISLRDLTYENFFEGALNRIALGHSLVDISQDDPRSIDTVEFMKWMRKDKERKQRFHEAQEIAAELLVAQTISIAAGENSLEDTNRSTLRVNTNFKVAAFYAPKRFGSERGLPAASGGGGIVINIGQVESPYAVVDVVSDSSTNSIEMVSDVEAKE